MKDHSSMSATRPRPEPAVGQPRGPSLRYRSAGSFMVVEFVNPAVILEEDAVRALGDELAGLIRTGRPCLVVNLRGVVYVSSSLLGRLAYLQRQVKDARGVLRLCGLAPLVREALRISHLDRVFEIYADEAEAIAAGAPRVWSEDAR